MRSLRVIPLWLALGACADRAQQPLATPEAATFPSGVTSCSVYGAQQDGATCELFDLAAGTFGGADAFTKRAYLYDRRLDLFHAPGGQVVNRAFTKKMDAGASEATWSADESLLEWDGYGDSSLWTHTALIAAAHRYASTGTDADLERMETYARTALRFFEATGIDGYQARFVFAGTARPLHARNGIPMAARENDDDPIVMDVPKDRVDALPASMRTPIPAEQGGTVAVRPSWRGYPSVDQYSGPLASLPIVVPLLKDRALADALVKQFDCFVKRLKIFRITHLSENQEIAHALAAYLGALDSNLEPGEPDPAKADEIWGFYLPQVNQANYATTSRACPTTLPYEPEAALDLDARDPQFQTQFVDLALRQAGAGRADAIDFAFIPNVRSGDAMQMLAIAHAGYQLTGDDAYLDWHDDLLVTRLKAPEIAATIDAYQLPKACTSYYREHNVTMTEYARVLATPEGDERNVHAQLFTDDFAGRMRPLGNPIFEIAASAATGTSTAPLAGLLKDLEAFGGTPEVLDDPRRNWDTDNIASPPAGITVGPPSAEEKKICEAGITLFGVPIPGSEVRDSDRYTDKPLPAMRRVNEDFIWQRDPFFAARHHGDGEATQQYPGLDLTLPYWMGRAHGLVKTGRFVLAWKK